MLAEHAAEHSARDREIRRTEKHPRNANRRVSGETGEDANRYRARPRFVFERNATDAFEYQIRTVQQTPDNKSPGGAVPKSAEEHDDDKVKRRTEGPDLIATERNVKVIAKKSGKRNVSPPPKIREADRGIRETKVVLEMETKG